MLRSNTAAFVVPAIVVLATVLIPVGLSGAEISLVPEGAVWSYLDDGSDPGRQWPSPAFDDTGWASGPAQLGYGDGDEVTVVSFGPDPSDKYVTTYFRHRFTVDDAAALLGLELRLLRDDGAVVYLNGIEIHRSNMPEGKIDYRTEASTTVSGSEEDAFESTELDPLDLQTGVNFLAVSVHQVGVGSSDVSFDLELVGRNDLPGVVRGPYLQRGTSSEVVVRWRTDTPTDGRVRYGTRPDRLDQIADGAAQVTEHEIVLNGLAPQTRYHYSVGTTDTALVGGDLDHAFITSPPIGGDRPVRIWVIGDSGTADSDADRVRDAYLAFEPSRQTDLWLLLGDNAYGDGTDEQYQDALFETYPEALRSTVLWPTLGNHDALSADSETESGPYFDIFSLPRAAEAGGVESGTEAYYSFDFGNVHFVCLDSADSDLLTGGVMLDWLEDDLAANTAGWTVAFWHHPPYSKGSHDSDAERRLIDMRENAVMLLEDYGVDLVFSGHSHAYERSVLLDSHYGFSDELDDSMKIDRGDGRVDGDGAYVKPTLGPAPHEGAVYVVAGSSGKTGGGGLDHPVMVTALDELGSAVLDVHGEALRLRFLQDDGTVADAFTLLKGTAAPPIELTVEPAVVATGDTVELTVSGANSGELVTFGVSAAGPGVGGCPPRLGGLCLDVQAPVARLREATADVTGVATLQVRIPPGTRTGRHPIQAAIARGPGGGDSVKTNLAFVEIR